jgi:hypothetical protein
MKRFALPFLLTGIYGSEAAKIKPGDFIELYQY